MLEVQAKSQWTTPVCVAVGNTDKQMIKGPHDALAMMTEQWPFSRGMEFVRARSVCRAALDGRKTVEEARVQFEHAVNDVPIHSS